MDYTTQTISYKVRKALRYTRLYGLRRTWTKVRGQYHMKKVYDPVPAQASPPPEGGHVGIIGCGNFSYSNIAYYLKRNYGDVLRACMDTDLSRAASLAERYGVRYFTDDAEKLMADPDIDLVYIASNHASHAEYAIDALLAGKAVHIEKPHCVREDQLLRLCQAMSETGGKVTLGYNRPGSKLGILIKKHLDAEQGAAMLNWFIAGHQLDPEHWYFQEEEGGRILGNLCHWTDFLYQMVKSEDRFPITITPTRSSQSDCDIAVTYLFGDGTIAALTFSAKGHTFEGVRERFAAHKGNVLIALDDFRDLVVEIVDEKRKYSRWFRDHGHERRICDSYQMTGADGRGEPTSYVWETGMISLKTKEALEKNAPLTVLSFADTFPQPE